MPLLDPAFLELTRSLDPAAFWAENALCQAPGTAKPRCSALFSPDDHWLFEFMSVPSTVRYYDDKPYRDALHREVNRITNEYVGQEYFEEDSWQCSAADRIPVRLPQRVPGGRHAVADARR